MLEDIRDGDAQCLAWLYDVIINRIYGLVYRIIRNRTGMEEIYIGVYKQTGIRPATMILHAARHLRD